MTAAGARGAAAALLLCSGAAHGEEPGPRIFLMGIDVEAEPGLSLAGPVRAVLELHPSAAAKAARDLREWFPRAAVERGEVALRLDDAAASSPPTTSQRGATFFVDVDEPPVAALRDEITRDAGPAPDARALEAFVDRWIEKKSWGRGLDPASIVARRREGDCTEHAVLLAAVARLFGKPSRVVLGIAVLEHEGRLLALGHAWSEIHEDGRWRLADAALHRESSPVRYLPLGFVRDEGPAYNGAVGASLSPASVKRLRLMRDRTRAAPPPRVR